MEKESKTKRLQRSGEVFLIPIDQVESDESRNFRDDYGDIEGLAESIKNAGQRRPILLKKLVGHEDHYAVVDGFRRLRAIKLLVNCGTDFPYVRAFLAPKNYSIEDAIFEQVIGNDGKPLSKVEEGHVYKTLIGRGYKEKEISEKTGKNISHVRVCIAIASLPKELQNNVSAGTLTGNTALEIYKSVGEDEQKAVEMLNKTLQEKKEKTGEKSVKVKPKDIQTIKSASPLKLLKDALTLLIRDGVKGQKVKLLEVLIECISKKCDHADIAELFK